MEQVIRQTWAFVFRGYHLTRRYISWVIVFNFYALVTSATVALIGVAAGNFQLTLTLVVGALMWNFMSTLYNEIGDVHCLRTLGGNTRVHVHGTGFTSDPFGRY